MFNLQQPTSVIEWMQDDAICVAGSSGTSQNEILELGLPGKLLVDPDAGGIHKDRDFDVRCGGFCDHAIQCLQAFPGERLVATSAVQASKVTISMVGQANSDLIQEVSTINLKSCESTNRLSMDRRPHHKAHLAFARSCSSLRITDVISQDSIYETDGSSEELCGVKFLDSNSLILSTNTTGSFQTVDVREKSHTTGAQNQNGENKMSIGYSCDKPGTGNMAEESRPAGQLKVDSNSSSAHCVTPGNCMTPRIDVFKDRDIASTGQQPNSLNFIFDVAPGGSAGSDHPIVQLHASGQLNLLDLRNLTKPCKSWKLGVLSGSSPYLKVKFEPNQSDVISISGFNNRVYIFDLKNAATSTDLKPVFVHDGHMNSELVLSHTWHPTVRDLVLSSDNEGSLHAWKWNRNYVLK
ncbi:WD repeat-containing protein 73-like isoform X2 [Anneissia japonica]|nr:WD repeat-containing protein 73-like isoform X2 [Anneissia japonica]